MRGGDAREVGPPAAGRVRGDGTSALARTLERPRTARPLGACPGSRLYRGTGPRTGASISGVPHIAVPDGTGTGVMGVVGRVGREAATMEKRVMTDSKRRRGLMAASALLSGVLVLTACNDGDAPVDGAGGDTSSSQSPGTSQQQVDEAAAQKTSQARIEIAPKNGADNVSINNGTKVTVADGKLTEVTMTSADGTAVEGKISADGASWEPTGQLKRSTTYKITAIGGGRRGPRGPREHLLLHRLRGQQLHRLLHAGGRLQGRRRHAGVAQLQQADHRQEGRPGRHRGSPPPVARRSSATGSTPSASTSAPTSTGRPAPPSR